MCVTGKKKKVAIVKVFHSNQRQEKIRTRSEINRLEIKQVREK